MEKQRRIAVLFVGFLSLVACSQEPLDVASQVGEDVENGAACDDFSSKLSATLAQALIDARELPTEEELRRVLEVRFAGRDVSLTEQVLELYRAMTVETREKLGASDKDALLAALIGLEIGDETTPEKAALKRRLRGGYSALKTAALASGMDCAPEDSEPGPQPEPGPEPEPEAPTPRVALPVEGAVRVLATAYQTCQAKRLPAMTASSDSVQGIVITGTHSNGVGKKREVGNLALLQRTHYYVREGIERDPSCFDVTKKPLIYDYGGKPYATSAVDSTLDFHRDAGTGTSVLGVDCSGYVFSALAASGLRVSPSKRLTASLVYGINARMYMEPVANGLSCLMPVPSLKDDALRDGDILASGGHVVMIDRVGEDPFGVSRLRSVADCRAENISYRSFDFEVLQSSPVKGGIGLDRMRASDYLAESSDMRTALQQYGVAACKARFGQTSTVKPTSARLVRHKLTAECMDRPVKLARESCVQACL